MADQTANSIDWPDQDAEDAYWDQAYNDYVTSLFVTDDRYSADIDRMMPNITY